MMLLVRTCFFFFFFFFIIIIIVDFHPCPSDYELSTVSAATLILSLSLTFIPHTGTPDKRPVFIEINTGMAHLPYFGPFAAYASSKAAAAKVIEYVQAEEDQKLAADASNQPGARAGVRLHNLQPGIIKTDMGSKSDLPEETWDDSMFFFFPLLFRRFFAER